MEADAGAVALSDEESISGSVRFAADTHGRCISRPTARSPGVGGLGGGGSGSGHSADLM